MFALMIENKTYNLMITTSTERAERALANERAFIGEKWGAPIFMIECGADNLI